MPLAPNQLLYEYRVERVLGQGAFGVVYLAHDTLLDRPVAIKELTIARQTDDTAFKRFLQEARVAGNINHPHIVTVHALKVVEPTVYLVMEYLTGGSLRALLEERGALPVEDAVRIAADVCEGLAAAHIKGIVHRDVKPENILLTEDGRAKVGDFGIAHVPRGAGGTFLTQAGFQPGTLVYMSPEQIRGQPVDGRSDVYQVGALLYEMLTGRHYVDIGALERQARDTAGSNAALFQARLYELLAEAVCEQESVGMCQALVGVPEWAEETVRAVLAKQIEQRPQMEALAWALRNGKAVHSTATIPSSTADFTLAEEHFNRAMQLRYGKEQEQVADELKRAIEIYPSYIEACFELGEVFQKMERFDEARETYQQAIVIDPSFAKAYIGLAEVCEQQGASENAITALQQAIRLDADCVRSRYYEDCLIGLQLALEEHRGQYLKVLSAYQRAIAVNPSSAEIHYNLGRMLALDLSLLGQALVEYQRAVSLRPDYPEALVAIGNAYLEMKQPERALSVFQQAIGMKWPEQKQGFQFDDGSFGRGDAYMGLAKAYIQLGKLDQANATVQLALEMDPEDGFSIGQAWLDAYKEQSEAHRDQGRFDLAATTLSQAVAIYSLFPKESMPPSMLHDWGFTYLLLALCYYRLGLQYLDRHARNEADQLLDNALEAWKTGYSILPSPDARSQRMWEDTRSKIESARKRTRGG